MKLNVKFDLKYKFLVIIVVQRGILAVLKLIYCCQQPLTEHACRPVTVCWRRLHSSGAIRNNIAAGGARASRAQVSIGACRVSGFICNEDETGLGRRR